MPADTVEDKGIAERLREMAGIRSNSDALALAQAASLIERLQAERDEARAKAIEECAKHVEGWPSNAGDDAYQTNGNGRRTKPTHGSATTTKKVLWD